MPFHVARHALKRSTSRLAGSVVLLFSRNQSGNLFAVAGVRDRFTAYHCAQELCEMGLGLGCWNFARAIGGAA